MSIQFHVSPVTEEYDRYLPGISRKPKFALWLSPTEDEFQSNDLQVLIEAFTPLKGIGWYALSTNESYNRLNTAVSIEVWPDLMDKVLSESNLSLMMIGRTVYSKVGWLSKNASAALPQFLKVNPLSGQGIISFIPPDIAQANNWSKIAQGPNWLWLCRDWIANAPDPSLAADAVTLSYIDLTYDMSGAPSLLWVDSDINTGLTFFGSEAVIAAISARLESSINFTRNAEVCDRLFVRGFYFDMCK